MSFKKALADWAENYTKSENFKQLSPEVQQRVLLISHNIQRSYEQNRCRYCGKLDNEEHPCDCIRIPIGF
jgi:hypothetical protein